MPDIEVTEDMIRAGLEEAETHGVITREAVAEVYRAMVEAAPFGYPEPLTKQDIRQRALSYAVDVIQYSRGDEHSARQILEKAKDFEAYLMGETELDAGT